MNHNRRRRLPVSACFFHGTTVAVLLLAATLTGQPQLTGSGSDSVVVRVPNSFRQTAATGPDNDTVLPNNQLRPPPEKKNAFTVSIGADGGSGFYLSPLNVSYEIKRTFGFGLGGSINLWEGTTITPTVYYLYWPVEELVATGFSLTGHVTFRENDFHQRYYNIVPAHLTRAYLNRNIYFEALNGVDIVFDKAHPPVRRLYLSQGIRIGYSAPACRNKLYENGLYRALLITSGTLQVLSLLCLTVLQSILYEWD